MQTFKPLRLAIWGALALAASASFANAADVYDGSVKDEPIPGYSTPLIGWTGFYFGGNLGGVWDDTDNVELFDDAILFGGFHAGYNWQRSSNVVIGLEADLGFMDDVEYLSTIRGRLGYSFGKTLAYVTGGVAFIGFDDELFGDESETGYVVGAGLDYKLRDNWSIGAEALYYGFDDSNDVGEDANFWAARGRLTYHVGSAYDSLK